MSDLIISFQGLDADDGHVEAFAGIESAAGLARALVLIGHYASTGVVRHRFPFDDGIQFYLESTEQGSFNWRLKMVAANVALGLTTNGIYDLIKVVTAKAIGDEPTSISQPVKSLNEGRSGDIDALVEAVEPALKKAHYGIGQTVRKIVIQESTSRKVIVTFDSASKDYLLDSVEGDDSAQDVSISALNVNDRTGRAYFADLNRTIPFRVSKDAEPDTMTVLSGALDRYAKKKGVPTRIYFTRVEAIDERLKRVVIFKAEDVADAE
ncbi:DUF7946 domain-containing protein [Sphingomonas aquatilis]|uniref:DUF7946 domain-containing protein n=1 Tax=Sphingomonas aquatilis TaxID=93063 RepID=UPI001FBB7606|nr:hypothetical protein [Sphingomonas aquatilis]GKS02371.1 hypothetical protein Aug2020_01010 [Sphingomonas aquatilis]